MENVHPLCIADIARPSNEGEYGVVNQPKSNDLDYETTHDIITASQQIDTLYI